jgi:hypothetical protein
LRYGPIPVKIASVNVSFYTNNSKMPDFELWHSCCKWAIWILNFQISSVCQAINTVALRVLKIKSSTQISTCGQNKHFEFCRFCSGVAEVSVLVGCDARSDPTMTDSWKQACSTGLLFRLIWCKA